MMLAACCTSAAWSAAFAELHCALAALGVVCLALWDTVFANASWITWWESDRTVAVAFLDMSLRPRM